MNQSNDNFEINNPAERDYHIIDIREDFEVTETDYNNLKPHERLSFQRINEWYQNLPVDKPVLFVCEHGRRSYNAAFQIRRATGLEAYSLIGGYALLRGE